MKGREFKKTSLFYFKIMQILKKSGTRVINFIPRHTILATKTYSITVKDEAKNRELFTDNDASFIELAYFYTYSTSQVLIENNYYTITITNTTDNIIIFKDKMYCSNQTLSDYEISNGVYIEQSTGDNQFIYYNG